MFNPENEIWYIFGATYHIVLFRSWNYPPVLLSKPQFIENCAKTGYILQMMETFFFFFFFQLKQKRSKSDELRFRQRIPWRC